MVKIKKLEVLDPKLFIGIGALLIIWLIFVSVVPPEYKPDAIAARPRLIITADASGQIVLDKIIRVDPGTNAFDAMLSVANVGYQDYGSLGVMIETINGTSPKENEFWKLFVNGEQAALGISAITINEDTTIEWKTEAIEEYLG